MLKHSDNMISRRQEVGRGLRLSVNQDGDRMDNPAVVHDINVLTVVASESYKDFVGGSRARLPIPCRRGRGRRRRPTSPARRSRPKMVRFRSPRPWPS
uniref:Uncharacterized protein n=1 Tax=Phenylobacterium glaciei TaxID=2803784 RepID=A0A974S955_9CAUL|nr:hypothetical protein JKL49_00945 [Phenylobacterium glaciei]